MRRLGFSALGAVAFATLVLVVFAAAAQIGANLRATPSDGVPRMAWGTSSGAPTQQSVGSIRSATIIVAGDIARCSELKGAGATADLVAAMAGFVMTAGDNAYERGTSDEFLDCYDRTWGRFVERTFPVPGNHDYFTSGASGYFGYFGERAGPAGRGYYAFSAGAWRIYVLSSALCLTDTGCGRSSEQYRWLEEGLRTDPARCAAAVMHHPWASSGLHGSEAVVLPLVELLHTAGAELVVSGHDHDYERFTARRPDGREDTGHGIRQFVVGTGGASLRGPGAARADGSEVFDAATHGVLRLTLHPTSYRWEFVPVAGGTFTDQGGGRCHGTPG
jgi:hypothetical protein